MFAFIYVNTQLDFEPSWHFKKPQDVFLTDSFENIAVNLFRFADSDSGEKTEEPTARKLQKATEKGQIPKSQDLSMAIILMIVTVSIYNLRHRFYGSVHDMFLKSFAYFDINYANNQDMIVCVLNVAWYWFLTMLPLFLIVIVVTLPVNLAQTGFSFSVERFQPDFNRFNPVSGMKKIIGKQAFAELVKSLIKLAILGYFPYKLFVDEYLTMANLFNATLGDSLDYMAWLMVKLILQMGLMLIVYGLFDLAYTRWKHIQDLKMTKQEVKEEYKNIEGDPQIRAKIRQKQREMSQRKMMSQVPSADVVVTNPTHYAVALKYDPSQGSQAPIVVAKGKNLIALKIREIAEAHGVPIRENKPLAQALYRQTSLDTEIPEDLYQVVAQLLTEIYRLRDKKKR